MTDAPVTIVPEGSRVQPLYGTQFGDKCYVSLEYKILTRPVKSQQTVTDIPEYLKENVHNHWWKICWFDLFIETDEKFEDGKSKFVLGIVFEPRPNKQTVNEFNII